MGHSGSAEGSAMMVPLESTCTNVMWFDLGRPWTFEAVLMAVLLAHEKLIEQVRMRLEAVSMEEHLPDGTPSD
jgi:hypothetical protein